MLNTQHIWLRLILCGFNFIKLYVLSVSILPLSTLTVHDKLQINYTGQYSIGSQLNLENWLRQVSVN